MSKARNQNKTFRLYFADDGKIYKSPWYNGYYKTLWLLSNICLDLCSIHSGDIVQLKQRRSGAPILLATPDDNQTSLKAGIDAGTVTWRQVELSVE